MSGEESRIARLNPWVTVNPQTGNAMVHVPDLPLDAGYDQQLEWAGLLSLRNEVQRTRGRRELVEIHTRACEAYQRRWTAEPEDTDEATTQAPE